MTEEVIPSMGPEFVDEGVLFRVWAPSRNSVSIVFDDGMKAGMEKGEFGFWEHFIPEDCTGRRYAFVLDGKGPFPDPASRFQPGGIHGYSEVINTGKWRREKGWRGVHISDYILEEVHIGTFTPEGTFISAVKRLPHLSKIGITAVEFMPVAQFYGKWNWGYDGVFLYAPQNSYGRPEDLRRLVSECHREGMAAVLDVVYNHIGPVGNCLPMFGPFLSERYATPWGKTLNFDGPYCDPVRRFILDNALYWLDEYGFDGLRLDAVHGIIDTSPKHILQELMEEADALAGRENRHITIIAESDLNDPRIVMERERCGYGITAQWNDDFHHSIHSFLTGERNGYYEDYGDPSFISRTLNDGFLYSGRYSHHLHKFRGSPWNGLPQWKLVVCSQNHDQIGNRAYGERLSVLVDIHKLKAAAALVLLSPFTPMLFMGEEYGERAPFLFFIDAEDRDFADAVREGRKAEFIRFGWRDTPDPDDENTFISSKLRWNMSGKSAAPMLRYYSHLIALRKSFIGGKRHSFFSAWTGGNVRLSYSNGFEVYVRMSKNASAVPDEGKVVMHSEWRDFGGRIERGSARGRELLPFSAVAVQL